MMACLDLCRAWMEEEGAAAYRAAARQVADLRRDYPSVSGPALDPARLVLRAPDGFAAQAALEGMGVWPEMADAGHVVFIPTCADTEEDFVRLRAALDAVAWGDGAPPLPSAPAGQFSPPSGPLFPGFPPPVTRRGTHLRPAGGPLSPQGTCFRAWGGEFAKNYRLFETNRL